MTYKITPGLNTHELKSWLQKALNKYGTYEGEAVNYTHADTAPVVMCVVKHGDELLLVKRAAGLADASGYWSTVNGFIDQPIPVERIVQQELREELSLSVDLDQIRVGKSYTVDNPLEKRRYITFPCLVELDEKPEIKLDREADACAWTNREQLDGFRILDDLPYTIDQALSLGNAVKAPETLTGDLPNAT
jgi:NADH pyrophosphatase NudC (nudix superfamily)